MGKELLDLSRITDRHTIRLPHKDHANGKAYELLNRAELGIYEFFRLDQLQQQATTLQGEVKGDTLTPKQEATLLRLLGEQVEMLVLKLEPAVLKTLGRAAREQIILAWVAANQPPAEEESGEASSRRTTSASSRGSRRSTAAARKPGSTRRSG